MTVSTKLLDETHDAAHRKRKLRIVNRLIRIALTKDARIFRGRFYFNENVGFVFAGLKISENSRCN